MHSIPWLRDTLPDALWLSAMVIFAPNYKDGMLLVCQVLDELDCVWAEAPTQAIDGRLTSFERVPQPVRWSFIERLIDKGLYEMAVTQDFANLLMLYPGAPGQWLIEPWLKRIADADGRKADEFLSKLLPPVWHGQSEVATHVKFLILRARFKAGTIHISSDVARQGERPFELFPKYPDKLTEEQLRFVRPTIRATFLAFAGDDPPGFEWAKKFWRANWTLYECRFADELKEENNAEPAEGARERILEARAELVKEINEVEERFEERAAGSDPDLYDPDRFEVLTGIVGRIVRLVSLLAHNPPLWHVEYGMYILRAAVESLIVFRWILAKAGDDDTIFAQFKDYGRGHHKLLKLHVDEQVASSKNPPVALLDYQRELESEVNADLLEEFQDIHLDATFSRESVRDMAKDVGMNDEYRFYYAPAS